MAVAAERLRNAGIGVSIQGITLGHGDDFESGAARPHPELTWGNIVDARNVRTVTSSCPRQQAFHDYLGETYALYAGLCRPSCIWLDDDLRVTYHAPARQLCFCDTCLNLFNRQHGEHWTRETLVEALDRNEGEGRLRRQWISFCQQSLAEVARDCRASRPRGFARHPDGLAACQFSPRTHGRTGLEPDARRAGGRDRTGPGFPAGKRILRRPRPQRHAAQGIRHGPPDPPSEAVRARNSRRGGRIQTPRDRQISSRPVRGVYVLPGHGSDSALVRDHLRRFGADAVVCGQLFQVAERLAPVLRAIRRLQPRYGTGRNRSLCQSRPCVARYGGGRTLFRMERCGIRRYDLRYGDTRPALLPRREPFVGTHHGRFGRAGTGPRRGRPAFRHPGHPARPGGMGTGTTAQTRYAAYGRSGSRRTRRSRVHDLRERRQDGSRSFVQRPTSTMPEE